MRAQASFEYLVILGLVLAALIPSTYLFYIHSQESNEDVLNTQISNVGNRIIAQAETINSLGKGSRTTMEVNFPDNIKEIYIGDEKELVIKYDAVHGTSESVFFTNIKINGSENISGKITIGTVHSGLNLIRIESFGDMVTIKEE